MCRRAGARACVCAAHFIRKTRILLLPFGSRCVVYTHAIPIRIRIRIWEALIVARSISLCRFFSDCPSIYHCVCMYACMCAAMCMSGSLGLGLLFFRFVLFECCFWVFGPYTTRFVGFVRPFACIGVFKLLCHWIRIHALCYMLYMLYIKYFSYSLCYDSNSLRFSVLCVWLCVAHSALALATTACLPAADRL